MKFALSNALLVALSCGLTASARSLNGPAIQQRMNGIPSKHWQRHLEQQQGFEVTGDYSVKFNECLSLSILDEEDGAVVAGTSDYVILDVIDSYDGSIRNFAVDLTTFVTTLANYIPDQMNDYCEACDYDYCMYGGNADADEDANDADENADQQQQEEGNQEEGDQEGEQGDQEGEQGDQEGQEGEEGDNNDMDRYRGRHLEQNNGKIVYVDCDTCSSLACFDNQGQEDGGQEDENVYSKANAVEWLLNLGECQAIDADNGYNYYDANGYALYAGYTCNSDGTGMEIAVFSDEECSMIYEETSYSSVLATGGNAATYQSMTSNLVHRVFSQYFDCMNTEYINPNEDADEDDADEDEDNEFDANEYCQSLVEGEMAFAMDESCSDGDGNNDNGYQYDENGNPWGEYTDGNGNTYYYDIQDAEDEEQVCFAIQGKNGEYTTALGSDDLYDYSNPKKNLNDDDTWAWDSGKDGDNDGIIGNSSDGWWDQTKGSVSSMATKYGVSNAEMWGIVAGSIIVGLLVLIMLVKCMCGGKNKKKGKISLDDDEDAVTRSRREPLVNNPEVYIA